MVWPRVKLGDLAAPGKYTFVGGPFGSSLTTSDYVDSGVPVIRGANLGSTSGVLDEADFAFVSESKADELHRNLAYKGDLVFTQRGTLGQAAVIPYDSNYDRYVVSQSQMKVTLDEEKADRRFVLHYYRSPWAMAQLEMRTLATGVPHINLGILKDFEIPLPPLEEQRRIADILDRADALRRKREQSLKLVDDLLQSVFLEMFGDPVTNPKGWPVKTLGKGLRETQYGTSAKANEDGVGLPCLRMNNITYSGALDLSDLKHCPVAESDVQQYTVERGDILFNRTNSPELVGKTAVWDREERFAFAGYLVRARVRPEKLDPWFVSGFLNSPYGKEYVRVRARPSNNMSNFNASMLREIPIPFPPIETQRRYRAVVHQLGERNKTLRADAALLAELGSALTQRAFRGEL